MKIKIKRLNKEAKLPSYAHPGDVGMDMFSLEDYDLKPGERRIFPCGFALEFETGFAFDQFFSRETMTGMGLCVEVKKEGDNIVNLNYKEITFEIDRDGVRVVNK